MIHSFTAEQRRAAGIVPIKRAHVVKTYEEVKKVYWRIGELAESLGIQTSMIRFWMREFDFDVRRGKGGTKERMFTAAEVDKVKEIHRLLKVEKYTIEGAKRKLREQKQLYGAK